MNRRRGFSLIELMIVVGILGVAAMLAAPNVSRIVSQRNSNIAALKVRKAIEAARDEARARRVCVRVERQSASVLRIEQRRPEDANNCLNTVLATRTIDLDAKYVSLPTTPLTFKRDGGLVSAAGADFVDYTFTSLSESGSKPHTVRIYAALGLVRGP